MLLLVLLPLLLRLLLLLLMLLLLLLLLLLLVLQQQQQQLLLLLLLLLLLQELCDCYWCSCDCHSRLLFIATGAFCCYLLPLFFESVSAKEPSVPVEPQVPPSLTAGLGCYLL